MTDLVFSPDGRRTACSARTDAHRTVASDGRCWDGCFDMAWKPVFRPDSRHIAVKVEKAAGFSKRSYSAAKRIMEYLMAVDAGFRGGYHDMDDDRLLSFFYRTPVNAAERPMY